MANLFAQAEALAFGRDERRTSRIAARSPGDRPSTMILADRLTPSVLGQLIALYEHIVFVQGTVWGINSFDQWGVELGKELANRITPELTGRARPVAARPLHQRRDRLVPRAALSWLPIARCGESNPSPRIASSSRRSSASAQWSIDSTTSSGWV